MEKHYRFAGAEVTLRIPEEILYPDDRQLAPFRVETVSDPWIFQFYPTDTLALPEGQCLVERPTYVVYENCTYRGMVQKGWEGADLRIRAEGKLHHVQWKPSPFSAHLPVKAVLEALDLPHLIHQSGGFLLHCSYIAYRGEAILFTAPSQTGKSTQAELWRTLRGAQIINGDRAAVRITQGAPMAEGIPFSGSSQYCRNCSLPLKAIVYLEQAPQTTIFPLRGAEAFRRVWEGCTVSVWDREDMLCATQAVQTAVTAVPVYRLSCTPDASAVEALEKLLESR